MSQAKNEQDLRRERSISRLKLHHVPYIDHLPPIEPEAQTHRRTAPEVGLRILCLALVSMKGAGADHDFILNGVHHYGVMDNFSARERYFLLETEPTEHKKLQFLWSVEAAHALLWSVQQVEELDFPTAPCDWNAFWKGFHEDDRDTFLERVSLRQQAEILDETDLIYRFHWASRDADLHGRAQPSKLNLSVVMERHKALNWLTTHVDEAVQWDDVSTDT